MIRDVELEVKIGGVEIKQQLIKHPSKTLGVHMSLLLLWDKQFEVMIEKMEVIVYKLKNTLIPRYLIYIVFNAYIMKLVYFGCAIVKLNQR